MLRNTDGDGVSLARLDVAHAGVSGGAARMSLFWFKPNTRSLGRGPSGVSLSFMIMCFLRAFSVSGLTANVFTVRLAMLSHLVSAI